VPSSTGGKGPFTPIPGLRRVERALAALGAGLDDVVEIEAQAVVLA
jgi:hypothetical protein